MTISPRADTFADDEQLASAARHVGRDWKSSPYYDAAERAMDRQWKDMIWPFLTGEDTWVIDFSNTLEIGAGHGRNSAKLLPLLRKLYLVDINPENISFLRDRFRGNDKVECHLTNGFSLTFLANHTISFIYSFDSMVHFDSDVIRAYLREFARILRFGGHGFIHHSNYIGNPGGDLHRNPGWRNFMSQEIFAHYACKEGLSIIRQKKIDWKWDETFIDCFTLFGAIQAYAQQA